MKFDPSVNVSVKSLGEAPPDALRWFHQCPQCDGVGVGCETCQGHGGMYYAMVLTGKLTFDVYLEDWAIEANPWLS